MTHEFEPPRVIINFPIANRHCIITSAVNPVQGPYLCGYVEKKEELTEEEIDQLPEGITWNGPLKLKPFIFPKEREYYGFDTVHPWEKIVTTDNLDEIKYEIRDRVIALAVNIEQLVRKRTIVEFEAPEPISTACPFCGDGIPNDTLRSPGFLCPDCLRPVACASCMEQVKDVGLKGCPWCSELNLDEDNGAIKKSLEEIRDKKLREYERIRERRRPHDQVIPLTPYKPPQPYVWENDNSGAASTDRVWVSSDSTTTVATNIWQPVYYAGNAEAVKPGDILVADDEYPSRVKPMQWKQPQDYDKDDITEILDQSQKVVGVAMDNFEAGDIVKVLNSDAARKMSVIEEAQRATGRTTQRLNSAIKHLRDEERQRKYEKLPQGLIETPRRVCFVVDTWSDAARVSNELRHLLKYRHKISSNPAELIMDRIDIQNVDSLKSAIIGRHYSLIIVDLALNTRQLYRKELKEFAGTQNAPVIGELEF